MTQVSSNGQTPHHEERRQDLTMQIPVFLLRKLYLKGSLKNNENGFTFKLKNSLAPGTAVAIHPLKVDGVEYPLTAITISSVDGEVKASEVTESKAFPIKVGVEITMNVTGTPLAKGSHKLDISLQTKEAGKLSFDVTDDIV